jgi:hypothetical protein
VAVVLLHGALLHSKLMNHPATISSFSTTLLISAVACRVAYLVLLGFVVVEQVDPEYG